MNVRVNVKKIRFSSYIKLFVLAALPFGLIMGIIGFLFSLIGGDAKANLGSVTLTGIPAGIVLIIMFPIIYGFFALIFSLLSYLPFKFMLIKLNGFILDGEFEIRDDTMSINTNENK